VDGSSLSIIVPTLDEAAVIGPLLERLRRLAPRAEVIVVDGGSVDATVGMARRAGARVVQADLANRGYQLHLGSMAATGETLLFLHADSLLEGGWVEAIEGVLRDPRIVGGHGSLRFAGDGRAARTMTRLSWCLARFGLCYGDSAYFVRRDVYERVGGFRPLPLFEDVDLLKRLRRTGRFATLRVEVVTSSRKLERHGLARMLRRWSWLQTLYWLGVPPARLARWYAGGGRSTLPFSGEARTMRGGRVSSTA